MRNEELLIASYFLAALVCSCLGVAAYIWLRHPVGRIFGALPQKDWGRILKRSFPVSTILLALSGFMSVSYYGCSGREYKDIVSDHQYILSVNQQQISKTLYSVVIAIFVWAVIILVSLQTIRRERVKAEGRGKN
jgi:hypothetical protein